MPHLSIIKIVISVSSIKLHLMSFKTLTEGMTSVLSESYGPASQPALTAHRMKSTLDGQLLEATRLLTDLNHVIIQSEIVLIFRRGRPKKLC